jgi:polar amino acid transport system substrate-binding protein
VKRGCARIVVALSILSLAVACSSATGAPTSGSSARGYGDPTKDLLAKVEARGTLVLPTDPTYPPASFAVKGATRTADTECASNQLTAAEISGYDAAVGKAIAAALGVEPCFVEPPWNTVLAGSWNDRWDLAISSIGIARTRMDALYFTQPYFASSESFFVRNDARYRTVEQLSGKRIGVCVGCFADLYLQKKLEIPGEPPVDFLVDHAKIVGYEVETVGLRDVGHGRLDAFLCEDLIGEGEIRSGVPLRKVGDPAYFAYIGGALDRSSPLSQQAFLDRVNAILGTLLADGTLKRLSLRFFKTDLASATATYSIADASQAPLPER